MPKLTRVVAALQLALIFPAALFLTAVLVGAGDAHAAQGIIRWYSTRGWTLGLLLLALPFAVLVIGCITLLRSWNLDVERQHAGRQTLASIIPAPFATLFVAGTTMTSAGVLAIVALHMLAN